MTRFFQLMAFVALLACDQAGKDARFSFLTPEQTGVDFRNDLTFNREFNIYTYRNYYNGGGIAAGDINNDGLVDLYFTGNSVTNRLYLNKGDFRFEDITEQAGVGGRRAWSTGVSMTDVDGDGLLDIYVCNSGDIKGDNKQNELFINNGDLTFTEKAEEFGLADQGFSTHAAFFDYDKDGDLDAYLLNNSYQAIGSFNLMNNIRNERDSVGGDKLYENRGGKFVDVSEEAGIYGSIIGFGLGVTVGDVNNDNWQDIFVSNDFFERDYLYINQQDGTFKEVLEDRFRSISAASMGADMADINNDLQPDIFVTDMLPEPDERLKQVTMFESWDKYQYKLRTGYYHQFSRNMLHVNNGDGSFTELGRYANVEATDWSWGALIFDMDNDGLKDIFVANGIYQDITDLDYLNFIADDETKKRIISRKGVDYKALVDPIPINPIPNYAFRNEGELSFENVAEEWGLGRNTHSNGSVYADLDNDGDLDLVLSNVNDFAYIYKNNTREMGEGGNYIRFDLTGVGGNSSAYGTKVLVETDRARHFLEQMPVRGFQSTVDHRMTFGIGDAMTIKRAKVIWPDETVTILRDLPVNSEVKLDQATAERSEENLGDDLMEIEPPSPLLKDIGGMEGIEYSHEENTYVDFDRDRLTYHMRSNEGPALAVGDVNDDGLDDMYFGGAKDQPGSLYIQTGAGEFLKKQINAFSKDRKSEDVDAVFIDVESDGDLDLIVLSGGSEFGYQKPELLDRVYINDGKGNFEKKSTGVFKTKRMISACIATADVDEDGDTDLFVGERMIPFLYGAAATGYMYLNDGAGNFVDASSEWIPDAEELGMITDASFQDIDGDGDEDLLVVGEWMKPQVFINEANKFELREEAVADRYGWWSSLHAVDLEQDGDIDFVAGNHGTNSRFKPSVEQPMYLDIYDFDSNGTIEHIYSREVDGKVLPYTLKQDLVMQIPSMKKEFLKFTDYKDKTLEEVFGPELLQKATRLTANWFYTSILRNDGKGNFTLEAMKGAAQYAPVYSIHSMENVEGFPDLLLGGNQYRAKPQVGIYAANHGVYYRNERGELNSIDHLSSGFYLEGEVRAIATVDVGSKRLLVVARTDDKPLFFEVASDKIVSDTSYD